MKSFLNKGQSMILSEAKAWYKHGNEQIFQYSGGPGTGKSWLMNVIIDELGIRDNMAPMAYTGAAAIVMRRKGLNGARSIHSSLYQVEDVPLLDSDGNPVLDPKYNRPVTVAKFLPKPLADNVDCIVIDEGSMVPMAMKPEIVSRNKPIIVSGDIDQLPPIDDEPAFLTEGQIYYLSEIMRQAEGSGIVYISNRIKNGLPIHNGFYGDVLVVNREELRDEMLIGADMIICARNKTRDWVNYHMRTNIMGYRKDLPYYGEKMICRKTNWNAELDCINLANGLIGRVSSSPDLSGFNGKTFTMNFMPNGFDVSFMGIECDYEYLKGDYALKQKLKNSPYSHGEKFEFANAITVHLSQGSQFDKGLYLEEYLHRSVDHKRLNYTAVTRFAKGMIYVKQPRKNIYNYDY